MLSKEHAITLPAALALIVCYELARTAPSAAEAARLLPVHAVQMLPFALLASVYLFVRRALAGGLTLPQSCSDNPAACVAGAGWRAVSYARQHAEYARLFVAPTTLCFDYSGDVVPLAPTAAAVVPSVVMYVCLAVLLWLLLRSAWRSERARQLLLAGGLAVVTFLPASNLLVTLLTTVAERALYLPSVALCMCVGLCIEWCVRRQSSSQTMTSQSEIGRQQARVVPLFCLCVCTLFVCWMAWLAQRTRTRNADWNTEFVRLLLRTQSRYFLIVVVEVV